MLNKLLVTIDDDVNIIFIELDKGGNPNEDQVSFLSPFEALLFALSASNGHTIQIEADAIDLTLIGLQKAVQDYLEKIHIP